MGVALQMISADEPQFFKEEKKNRIKMEIARRRQQVSILVLSFGPENTFYQIWGNSYKNIWQLVFNVKG
jgi:hypothetical protein